MRLLEKFGYEYSGANNVAMRTNNALVQTFASDGANQLTYGSLYAERTWANPGHTCSTTSATRLPSPRSTPRAPRLKAR